MQSTPSILPASRTSDATIQSARIKMFVQGLLWSMAASEQEQESSQKKFEIAKQHIDEEMNRRGQSALIEQWAEGSQLEDMAKSDPETFRQSVVADGAGRGGRTLPCTCGAALSALDQPAEEQPRQMSDAFKHSLELAREHVLSEQTRTGESYLITRWAAGDLSLVVKSSPILFKAALAWDAVRQDPTDEEPGKTSAATTNDARLKVYSRWPSLTDPENPLDFLRVKDNLSKAVHHINTELGRPGFSRLAHWWAGGSVDFIATLSQADFAELIRLDLDR